MWPVLYCHPDLFWPTYLQYVRAERETEKQTDRERSRQRQSEKEAEREIETDIQIPRHTGTGRHTYRDRQTET